MTSASPSASALNSSARWPIDLSPGSRSAPVEPRRPPDADRRRRVRGHVRRAAVARRAGARCRAGAWPRSRGRPGDARAPRSPPPPRRPRVAGPSAAPAASRENTISRSSAVRMPPSVFAARSRSARSRLTSWPWSSLRRVCWTATDSSARSSSSAAMRASTSSMRERSRSSSWGGAVRRAVGRDRRVAQVLEPAQVVHQVAELRERERLLGVGPGLGRLGVDLDDQPVRARRDAGDRHGSDQRPVAGAVRGVDHDRQVGPVLEHRHRVEVERVAGRRLVRPDAALHEHHVGVARRTGCTPRPSAAPRWTRRGRA